MKKNIELNVLILGHVSHAQEQEKVLKSCPKRQIALSNPERRIPTIRMFNSSTAFDA
jgi:hypothetical protein